MTRVSSLFAITLVLAASLVAGACASYRAPEARPSENGLAPASQAPTTQTDSSASQSDSDRLVVRTAYLRLVVANVDEVISKAAQLAREMGGYVVSSESQDQGGDRIGKAALRIPADRLDETLTHLKELSRQVQRENVTAKDVTEEFVDQEARLNTLRATEDQYLQILKSANNIEDIIKIQQSLGQVREQIERTEGRIQYLRRTTETALVNLDLYTAGTARQLNAGGWDAQETFSSAVQGLVAAGLLLAGLGIWIVVFTPLWLPTVLLIRWRKRRNRRRVPPPPTATADPAAI